MYFWKSVMFFLQYRFSLMKSTSINKILICQEWKISVIMEKIEFMKGMGYFKSMEVSRRKHNVLFKM